MVGVSEDHHFSVRGKIKSWIIAIVSEMLRLEMVGGPRFEVKKVSEVFSVGIVLISLIQLEDEQSRSVCRKPPYHPA